MQHFEDVLGLVPNLNWSAGTSRPRYFQLRGIGELEQWQGAPNPSVGFLIDGIDFSGVGMPATLADVDRIEVLRGPQGTVYGANALGGLISVNTRAPRRESDASANLLFGDYGTHGINGVVGGPIGGGETAWRFAAGNYRSDGFRRDSYLNRNDTNGYDESNARLRVSAQPLEHAARRFHGDVGGSRQWLRRLLHRQFAHHAFRQTRPGCAAVHAGSHCASTTAARMPSTW